MLCPIEYTPQVMALNRVAIGSDNLDTEATYVLSNPSLFGDLFCTLVSEYAAADNRFLDTDESGRRQFIRDAVYDAAGGSGPGLKGQSDGNPRLSSVSYSVANLTSAEYADATGWSTRDSDDETAYTLAAGRSVRSLKAAADAVYSLAAGNGLLDRGEGSESTDGAAVATHRPGPRGARSARVPLKASDPVYDVSGDVSSLDPAYALGSGGLARSDSKQIAAQIPREEGAAVKVPATAAVVTLADGVIGETTTSPSKEKSVDEVAYDAAGTYDRGAASTIRLERDGEKNEGLEPEDSGGSPHNRSGEYIDATSGTPEPYAGPPRRASTFAEIDVVRQGLMPGTVAAAGVAAINLRRSDSYGDALESV